MKRIRRRVPDWKRLSLRCSRYYGEKEIRPDGISTYSLRPLSDRTHNTESDSPKDESAQPARRKRGCFGCLGVVLLVALILAIPAAFILNGPGFRKLAHWGIGKGLAAANLSGDFEVDGTLLSGIEIRDLVAAPSDPAEEDQARPAGQPTVRRLAVGLAEVRYEMATLVKGDPIAAIELVRLHDVTAEVELPPASEKAEPATDEAEVTAEKTDPLEIVWKALGISYDLENINIRLSQEGTETLALEGLVLKLPGKDGGGDGELGFSRLQIADNIHQGAAHSSLRSTSNSLVVGRFEPIDGIALTELTLLRRGADLLTAGVEAAGGSLFVRYSKDGSLAAELRDGPIDAASLAQQFGAGDAFSSGMLDALDVRFAGDFANPSTWNTAATVTVSTVAFPVEGIDAATLVAAVREGKLTAGLDAERKGATIHAETEASVSGVSEIASLADLAAVLELSLDVPAIGRFLPENSPPIGGGATLTAEASIASRQLRNAKANLLTRELSYQDIPIDALSVDLTAADSDAKAAQMAIALILDAESQGAKVHLQADANADRNAELASLADLATDVELSLDVPAFEKLLPENAPPVRGGASLDAIARIESRELLNARADLTSQSLSYGDVPIDSLEVKVANADMKEADLSLAISLDEGTRLTGGGHVSFEKLDYSAELNGNIEAEDRLARLLATFNFDKALAGQVKLGWRGEGRLRPGDNEAAEHSGKANIAASDLRIAEGRLIESATLSASYSPDAIELETLDLRSDDLAISTAASYREKSIAVSSLSVRKGDLDLVSGSLLVPFDPAAFEGKGAMGFFEQDGEINIDLDSAQLKIEDLAALGGVESPVHGDINALIDITGTPRQLAGGGDIRANDLTMPAKPDIPAADLGLQFSLEPESFAVSGKLDHPYIETLQLDGSMPFTPEKWLSGESVLLDEALQARLTLPPSSLEFLKDFAPAIETLAASAAVDVAISGTIGEPQASGTLDVAVEQLKLANPSAPRIRDATIKLRAEGRELMIETFEALVSGGQISLGGKVSLPAESDGPVFDLSATAREALVARNRDLSVRTNADLSLVGPWSKARLAGEIGLTNSRYVKEIDLLPLSMPRRDRSDLPEIESRPTAKLPPNLDLGIEAEPFRDWEFDVKLVTADPFLVRSNLAQIDIVSDLRVTGTGAKPIPSGLISVNEGRLTLPFSRVEIDKADIVFSEATGFNAELDVQANAVVRSNRINMFVFGRVLDPKNVLTSEPPLPNEDILSLLATGVTRDELTGGSGAAVASRVARLFLQELRQDNVDPDDERGLMDAINDRTTVDFGQTDPRTGQQTLAGRIRLLRQFYLVANVGVESDYRVLLKYIFKFR